MEKVAAFPLHLEWRKTKLAQLKTGDGNGYTLKTLKRRIFFLRLYDENINNQS